MKFVRSVIESERERARALRQLLLPIFILQELLLTAESAVCEHSNEENVAVVAVAAVSALVPDAYELERGEVGADIGCGCD